MVFLSRAVALRLPLQEMKLRRAVANPTPRVPLVVTAILLSTFRMKLSFLISCMIISPLLRASVCIR
jgi:hypothetical protein